MANNPRGIGTGTAKLAAEERRKLIAEALRAGLTYDKIRDEHGIAKGLISQDLKKIIARLREQQDRTVEDWRAVETERLDKLQAGVWEKATAGDITAIHAVLRIMERRARMWGLDAPVEVTGQLAVTGVIEVHVDIDYFAEVNAILADAGAIAAATFEHDGQGVKVIEALPAHADS